MQQELSERVEARRVLLVEPQQEVRGVLKEILEYQGYHVIPVENGEAARRGVAKEDPDIALIEVMLNDECGAALGEEFVAAGLPVIVVTGHADAAGRLESRSLWQLNKPLRGDALNMMIREILSGTASSSRRGEAMMAMQGEAGAVLAPQVPLANDRAGIEELHDLRQIVRERSWVEARRDIFSEGEIPNELRIVVRGLACRYKIMMDGSRRIIGFIFPGDACNADLLCVAEMDHGVRTIIRTEIVSVTRDKLLELMQVNPAIARVFWSSIAQDTAILRQWLVKMGHQKAPGRVAHLLYEVFLRCQMVGAATADTCILQLTQDELADTLGLTPVHMNRVLQRLRKEGLIQLVGRRLTILDQQGLAAAADFDPKYHKALRRTPLGVQLGLRPPDRVSPPV